MPFQLPFLRSTIFSHHPSPNPSLLTQHTAPVVVILKSNHHCICCRHLTSQKTLLILLPLYFKMGLSSSPPSLLVLCFLFPSSPLWICVCECILFVCASTQHVSHFLCLCFPVASWEVCARAEAAVFLNPPAS